MRRVLGRCIRKGSLKYWIGDELNHPSAKSDQSSIVAIPYFIHGKAVGAVGILGPIRMPYPKIFGLVRAFSKIISQVLTRNLYKHKITYREPKSKQIEIQESPQRLIKLDQPLQLENKT